jgi:putative transcriptional regulator
MKKKSAVFDELKSSLESALAYERGQRTAGLRVTHLPPPPRPLTARQIRRIRTSLNLSQVQFARVINVSPNAVRSWEQGLRNPREATLKLLTIAQKRPDVLLQV